MQRVCRRFGTESTSGSSLDGWGGGLKRGGADCKRSHPGEGAGGGHPSRPATGYGGALEAPLSGSGAPPQKPALFALENPPKLRKNCKTPIATCPIAKSGRKETQTICIF